MKAGAPVATSIVDTVLYCKPALDRDGCPPPSEIGGWLCNLIILGGIVAVAMSAGCPNCSTTALVAASFSDVFASWMAKENVRLMRAPLGVMRAPIPGLKDRIGGDFNQTALIDYILGFFLSLPVLYTERNQLSAVVTNPIFLMYTAASGVSLCLHNELATKTVRATGGMTSKVSRALMRALLIFGVSAALVPGAAIAALTISINLVVDWLLKRTSSLKGGRGG